MSEEHTEYYLGDGLYASFDAGVVKLRAEDDHIVYLDPYVLREFIAFIKEAGYVI